MKRTTDMTDRRKITRDVEARVERVRYTFLKTIPKNIYKKNPKCSKQIL